MRGRTVKCARAELAGRKETRKLLPLVILILPLCPSGLPRGFQSSRLGVRAFCDSDERPRHHPGDGSELLALRCGLKMTARGSELLPSGLQRRSASRVDNSR